ncbi:MAG: hypothetical protein KC492_36555, partial [Myxococcales bacterium]|nr:hypothetical protein [Myxococcales bacterium]
MSGRSSTHSSQTSGKLRNVGAVAVVLFLSLLACKENAAEEEEEDAPTTADCTTPAKLSCLVADTCHIFFSSNSAQQIATDCQKLGGTTISGACTDNFTQCCINQQSSYGEPEAICINDSNPSAGDFRQACRAQSGSTYCS